MNSKLMVPVLAIVVVAIIGVGIYIALSNDNGDDSSDNNMETPSVPGTDNPSDDPSDNPSDDPSDNPSDDYKTFIFGDPEVGDLITGNIVSTIPEENMEIRFVVSSINGNNMIVNVYVENEYISQKIDSLEIPLEYYETIALNYILLDGDESFPEPVGLGEEIIETPRGMALCNHMMYSDERSTIHLWYYDGTGFVVKIAVENEGGSATATFDSNRLIETI